MTRKSRTQDELIQASEHLRDEMAMLIGTASGLASGITGESLLTNALLESFTLHARALLHFFYAVKPRPDDVVAEDFVSTWTSKRPTEPAALSQVHSRVGKEIAHLTYQRVSVAEGAKQWRFVEVAEEIRRVLDLFVQMTPDNFFGPKMTEYKVALGG